jgi:hypothetical protein
MRSASRLNSRTPRVPRSRDFESGCLSRSSTARIEASHISRGSSVWLSSNAIARRAAFDDAEPLTFLGAVAEGAVP